MHLNTNFINNTLFNEKFFVFLLVPLASISFSQPPIQDNQDFESDDLSNIDSVQNWVIKKPDGVIFDSAYRSSRAILTDLDKKNDTTFVFDFIPSGSYNGISSFEFYYKLDATNSNTKAYILYNGYISDEKWVPVKIEEDGHFDYISGDRKDTTFFENTGGKWRSVFMQIPCYAIRSDKLKSTYDLEAFRFVYEHRSDSNSNEGWMIDDLEVTFFRWCSGIDDLESVNKVTVFPSTARAGNILTISDIQNIGEVEEVYLLSALGKKTILNFSKDQITIGDSEKGLLTLLIQTEKGLFQSKILVID